MKLVPLTDRVVLKQLEAEETTASGIVLPGAAQEKPQEAEVIAVGPGGVVDGKEIVMQVKEGQKVIYSKYAGTDVELDGEAYFEVAKNKKIPFFVNTEINRVKVVGTHFNVCAYKGSNEFETTLIEGIVDIYPIGSDQVITRLTKDEFFGSYNGKYKKTTLPSYEYLRWKEGLYCFDDAPFNSLLNKLEKYYNVNISVRNLNILNYRCTGKFKEQDGIEHILKVIQKDHKFTYSINEEKDSIIIE